MRKLLFFLLLSGCVQNIELSNFNKQEWKSDLMGCSGLRSNQFQEIMAQKMVLLEKSESAIVKLLGSPDKNQLSSRNQKIYHYYTLPGPNCASKQDSTSYLSIRFNAVGLSSEVLHYKQQNN